MATRRSRLLMLIDDEPAQSRLVSALAAREGWRTLTVASGEEALETLASPEGSEVRAILLDQWVPGDAACDLIRELRAARPEAPVLMLTASTSPMLAVEAMRAGATDYLIKPVDPDRLLQALASASRAGRPNAELQPMAEKLPHPVDFDAMVGTAAPFRTALAKAATAARGHAHVLVEGESGTGKDMLTQAMHAASTRAKATMRVVHCGGVPPASLESLLFGHEKGAFAGAFDRQKGLIEHCEGGTLILDDVDRLPNHQQERLADVLASGIVRPTGATHGFRIDVRIFATSDFALDELVAAGEFSQELFDQLDGTRIRLPALRDRLGDLPALTRYFLAKIGEQPGLKHHSIADSALSLLEAYDWPGNVRQLQAVLFRACVFEQREAL
ncbi:MAG: sigma-54-dependent transcriptional regulator, partial [Erythrobacter sp.]